MASIHKLIITMLKAHKKEEEERKTQLDPFSNKEYSKQKVAKKLEFAEAEAPNERISFAQLPKHIDVENEDQRRGLGEVRNLYTHLMWKDVPEEQQQDAEGATWLELFILFHRHQGSMDYSEDALANKNSLQKEVAAFKKLSRKVFMLACPADKEWIIKPSTTRKNRLRNIAVANTHASIKGMPIVCEEENKQIVKRLLALRGIRSIKQKKVWEDGNLYLKPTVISLKGGTTNISTNDKDEQLTNLVAKGYHGSRPGAICML